MRLGGVLKGGFVLLKISRSVRSFTKTIYLRITCVILNRWGQARKENKIIMQLSGNRLWQKTATQNSKLKNQVKTFIPRFCNAELLVLPAQHTIPSFSGLHIPLSGLELLEGLIKPRGLGWPHDPRLANQNTEITLATGIGSGMVGADETQQAKNGHVTQAWPMRTLNHLWP